jgi:hypothetical protein
MDDMPRPRPPYLHREKTRHGKMVWVVRRNGKRRQLRSQYGTPEFEAEYRELLAGMPRRARRQRAPRILCHGLSHAIGKRPRGRDYQQRLDGNARTSFDRLSSQRAISLLRKSPRQQSSPVAIGEPEHRPRRDISLMPCAAYSAGQQRHSS